MNPVRLQKSKHPKIKAVTSRACEAYRLGCRQTQDILRQCIARAACRTEFLHFAAQAKQCKRNAGLTFAGGGTQLRGAQVGGLCKQGSYRMDKAKIVDVQG